MTGRKLGITVLELQPCFCTWRSVHLCTRPGSGLCSGSGFLGFQPLWHWQMWHWHLQELPEEAGRLVEGGSGPCSLLGFIFWWRCQHPIRTADSDCWGGTIWVGHLKFLTSASFYHTDPLWECPVFHGDHGTKTRTVKAGEETPLLRLLPQRPRFLLDQPARLLCLFQVPSVVHLRGLFLGHRDHICKGCVHRAGSVLLVDNKYPKYVMSSFNQVFPLLSLLLTNLSYWFTSIITLKGPAFTFFFFF